MSGSSPILFCVGAQKSGTTWLHSQLASHPECSVRSVKELHYFNSLEGGKLEELTNKTRRRLRHLRLSPEGTPELIRDTSDWLSVLEKGAEDIPAYLAYLTKGAEGRLVTDITPAYALLPKARLRQMARLAPDVRFIYLMRDPVDRLWSKIRMSAEKKARTPEDVPGIAKSILSRLLEGRTGAMTSRGDYAAVLRRLSAAVPAERRMIDVYEEVLTSDGLSRLWSFLGVSPLKVDLGAKVFAGVPVKLSSADASMARQLLAPQYDAVAEWFGRMPPSWRGPANSAEVVSEGAA